MKKLYAVASITLALFLALTISAWGATVSLEFMFSNLSLTLNSATNSLRPNPTTLNGSAFVCGYAGSPMEDIRPGNFSYDQYNPYNSYQGGPWLEEMTTWGLYDNSTNNIDFYGKVILNCPPDPFQGLRYSSVEGSVVTLFKNITFNINQAGSYQTHITGDYSYTFSLDNSDDNEFGSISYRSASLIYGIPGQAWPYDITMQSWTGTGHVDFDFGTDLYLYPGSLPVELGVTIGLGGQGPWVPCPIPGSIFLFSTGILGLVGWRYQASKRRIAN